MARLPESTAARLEVLAEGDAADRPGPSPLGELRSGLGGVSLASLLAEIAKLERIRALGLPAALVGDFKRVQNKEAILYRLTEAALEHPGERVRDALYPIVGEQTLRDLVCPLPER
jgi:hypothetical protein